MIFTHKGKGLIIILAALAVGCAQVPKEAGFGDIQQLVGQRVDYRLYWNQGSEADTEVAQAIENLLSNASKYSPSNTTIALDIWIDERDLRIIVTDEGICVLDFSFSSPGLPAFDLACYWHKIEDLKGSLIHGKKSLEVIQNAFLQGYGATFDLARPDIKLGLTRLILSKMLTLLDTGHEGFPGWIENRRRYSTYLRLLESGFDSPNH